MSRPVNFRDVGETLGLWLDPSPIPAGRLFRGGRLDALTKPADLGYAATVLNLRRGPDPTHLDGVRYLHVPAADDLENYETDVRRVRTWLSSGLKVLADPHTAWPVYVHCTSGRDRTGVLIASALLLLEVPPDVVIAEYLLSEGAKPSAIQRAVAGILSGGGGGSLGVNPARLRAGVLGRR